MRRLLFALVVPVLIAVPVVTAADSETVLLESVLSQTSTRLEWDPYRNQGALVRGDDILTFALGTPMAVENLSTVHSITPPRREAGTISFGGEFLPLARTLFPRVTQPRRVAAIYIDPGHGGRDPGAIGRHTVNGRVETIQEKDVVLEVGRRLRTLLSARFPEKKVVMSRDHDEYLALEERTNRANRIRTAPNEAVIFVSIHANASLNAQADGFEVWFLPPEFRRRNLVSAESSGVNDPDVLSILNTMREEEITIESILLARKRVVGAGGNGRWPFTESRFA